MLIILLIANVGVFLAMAASTGSFEWDSYELIAAGGNLGQLSLHGQWWRLFFATYIHAGFGHLLGNMALLCITGGILSARIGPTRLFLAYTATGLAASLASALGHPDVVSVGASGAIAGLLGVMVVLYASGRLEGMSGRWLTQTIVINAVYSFAPSVDWLAHLGGFGAGLAWGAGLAALLPERFAPGRSDG